MILQTKIYSTWAKTHNVRSQTLIKKLQRDVLFLWTMQLSAGKPSKPCKPLKTTNSFYAEQQANNISHGQGTVYVNQVLNRIDRPPYKAKQKKEKKLTC